jgi:hypothetical protein
MYSMSLVRTISNSLGLCFRFVPMVVEDQLSCSAFAWFGQIFFLVIVGESRGLASTGECNHKYNHLSLVGRFYLLGESFCLFLYAVRHFVLPMVGPHFARNAQALRHLPLRLVLGI